MMFSCSSFKIENLQQYNIIAESKLVQLNFQNSSYNASSIEYLCIQIVGIKVASHKVLLY